jgi:hypothetical protein
MPDAVLAIETAGANAPAKSMDRMSPQELERFVQQLNESANWRKYRRPGDPPDFVPGKPVKVMHGAGSSLGRGGGMRSGGQSFRRGGLANRRNARVRTRPESRRRDGTKPRQLAVEPLGFSSSSGSRSSFGNSSRNSNNSGFGNTGSNSSFGGRRRNALFCAFERARA